MGKKKRRNSVRRKRVPVFRQVDPGLEQLQLVLAAHGQHTVSSVSLSLKNK